jgi:dTDP-4-dehydrorhamnose reductase
MDTVLVFGSTGQLGTDLVEVLRNSGGFNVIALAHEDADCRDNYAVRRVVLEHRPQIVINCAAYVKVDDCEDHPHDAFEINAIGALNIARATAEVDGRCVYISTDYVFDGEKKSTYVESDPTCPINVYGASKLAGEHLVRQTANHWLIVRTASLFGKTGARGKGGNFVETILAKAREGKAVKVVDDIRISPTYASDAAKRLMFLIEARKSGIHHVVNSETCTWFEFAKTAIEICGLSTNIEAINSKALLTRAVRPKNSALKTEIDEELSTVMPSWTDGLRRYLFGAKHGKTI